MSSYGRHVQELIEYCKKLSDRQQRTQCAQAIIKVMETKSPEIKQQPNHQQILWDHLAKMSNYELDIDYPVAIQPKEPQRSPRRIPVYTRNQIQYRHYGHLLEELVKQTSHIKQPKLRREAINLTANQMKRSYLTWVRPDVDNNQILQDLHTLSHGRISANQAEINLKNTKKLLAEMQACPASDIPTKSKKAKQENKPKAQTPDKPAQNQPGNKKAKKQSQKKPTQPMS